MATVAKPFNTTTRRFRAGAPVSPTDDLSPHAFADLKTRGFIVDETDAKAAVPPIGKRAQPRSE